MNILAIHGQTNAGKDTAAGHLTNSYGYQKVAFADPVKRIAQLLFAFTDDQLWGPSALRNEVDVRYTNPVGHDWQYAEDRLHAEGKKVVQHLKEVTTFEENEEDAFASLVYWFNWVRKRHSESLSPRIVIQTLGTEWGRERLSESVWIDYLQHVSSRLTTEDGLRYEATQGLVVDKKAESVEGILASDARFVDELEAIRGWGGAIIKLRRPDTDDVAVQAGVLFHRSEKAQADIDENLFDCILQNGGTLDELYASLDLFVSTRR